MNIENHEPGNCYSKNTLLEPATHSCGCDAMGELSDAGCAFPSTAVKRNGNIRPMFVIGGVMFCMGLTSCFMPPDTHSSGYSTSYRQGYRVDSLPGGYRTEMIGGTNYYYHNGHYYQPSSRGYVVVAAPRQSRYYGDYGRYQRTSRPAGQMLEPEAFNHNEGRYEHGEIITRLPAGYREVNHRGDTYYRTGDRYYRRQGDRYIIVGSPF